MHTNTVEQKSYNDDGDLIYYKKTTNKVSNNTRKGAMRYSKTITYEKWYKYDNNHRLINTIDSNGEEVIYNYK